MKVGWRSVTLFTLSLLTSLSHSSLSLSLSLSLARALSLSPFGEPFRRSKAALSAQQLKSNDRCCADDKQTHTWMRACTRQYIYH